MILCNTYTKLRIAQMQYSTVCKLVMCVTSSLHANVQGIQKLHIVYAESVLSMLAQVWLLLDWSKHSSTDCVVSKRALMA
jgi:hypothetical protein